MKKLLYLVVMGLAVSCSSNTNTNTESEEENNTETTEQEETVAEEESTAVEEEEAIWTNSVLGNWEYYEPAMKMNIEVTFNEDNSFEMKMGPNPNNGTWEATGENELLIKTAGAPNGQTWLTELVDENSLNVTWKPNSASPKTIPFKRK